MALLRADGFPGTGQTARWGLLKARWDGAYADLRLCGVCRHPTPHLQLTETGQGPDVDGYIRPACAACLRRDLAQLAEVCGMVEAAVLARVIQP